MTSKNDQLIKSTIENDFTMINSDIELNELAIAVGNQFIGADKDLTLVIPVIGGGGAGKSILLSSLMDVIDEADGISSDDYVVGDRDYRRKNIEGGDPLKKFDFDLMNNLIQKIKNNKDGDFKTPVPTYDEETGLGIDAGKENYKHQVGKVKVLFVEGVFASKVIDPDFVIFLHASEDLRIQNQIKRAKEVRNEGNENDILENFKLRQKLEYIPYVLPFVKESDIIIELNKNIKYNLYKRTLS